MTSAELLLDTFERVRGAVHRAIRGLTSEQLMFRVDGTANSIAWLIWHLTRIQDDHIAGAAGLGQVWTSKGWADRFGLPFPPSATGYGHDSREVAGVQAGAEALAGYHDEVFEQTLRHVQTL